MKIRSLGVSFFLLHSPKNALETRSAESSRSFLFFDTKILSVPSSDARLVSLREFSRTEASPRTHVFNVILYIYIYLRTYKYIYIYIYIYIY
jgi:hypothetical protein